MLYGLWKQYFPEFSASHDPVIKQLIQAAILVNQPAIQQLFYPGKPCEHYL